MSEEWCEECQAYVCDEIDLEALAEVYRDHEDWREEWAA